jgi:hypothetical protein
MIEKRVSLKSYFKRVENGESLQYIKEKESLLGTYEEYLSIQIKSESLTALKLKVDSLLSIRVVPRKIRLFE